MPLLGTRGAASAAGYGFTALTGGGYIAFVAYNVSSSSNPNNSTGDIFYTANGSIFSSRGYATSCVPTSSNIGVFNGTFAQQQNLAIYRNGSISYEGQYMAYVSGSDTIYVRGSTNNVQMLTLTNASTTPTAGSTMRTSLSRSGYNLSGGGSIRLDASNNIHYQHYAQFNVSCCVAYQVPMVTKATMSAVTWSRVGDYKSGINTFINNIDVASGGNVYAMGSYSPGYLYLLKFNSSGTKQWDYYYASARNESSYYTKLVVDSSENIYLACASTSPTVFAFMKFNSAGTMQFRVEITGTDYGYVQGLEIGADGYIYLLASMRRSSTVRVEQVLFKFDSSGTLLYQRAFTSTDASFNISAKSFATQSLSIGADGFVYIGIGVASYPATSTEVCIFFKYGASGSTLGSYTLSTKNVTIATGTYTVSAGSTSAGTAANYTFTAPTVGPVTTSDTVFLNSTGYTSTKVAT